MHASPKCEMSLYYTYHSTFIISVKTKLHSVGIFDAQLFTIGRVIAKALQWGSNRSNGFNRPSNRRSQCCQVNRPLRKNTTLSVGLSSASSKKEVHFFLRGLPTALSHRSLRVFPPLDSFFAIYL